MSNHNLSEARWNANRANSQHSTGPRTDSGKKISSKNAVKTALTGRTVLLPTDDADRYQLHLESFRTEWAPEGQRELYLVQSVADAGWRLERIASFEMAIYATERTFLANAYNDEPEAPGPRRRSPQTGQSREQAVRSHRAWVRFFDCRNRAFPSHSEAQKSTGVEPNLLRPPRRKAPLTRQILGRASSAM